MPETITRRAALAAAGAALLTQIAHAQESAPEPKANMFTFALLSDTHLGRGGEGPSAQMKAAIAEINASQAELMICCGDLVNAGESARHEIRYPEWVEISKACIKPTYAVPGNHDPAAMFKKHIRPETEFVIDRAPFRFICFADALPNPEHQGAVTPQQLDWIESQIQDAKSKKLRVFLVAHIIFHHNAGPDHGWMIRDGRDAFGEMLKRNADTILAFFAGHFHNGLRGWSDTFGIHEIVLPSGCWNFDGKRMKNAPGFTFEEDRPGWTLVEVAAKKMTLSYKPIGAEIQAVKHLGLKSE